MAKSNIDITTLKNQIRAEMAWQRLIGERYGSNVHITENDVTTEYDRYVEAMAHPQYLVSEIYLPIENPDQEPEVARNAAELLADLRRGAPFSTLARQFSKAPSASAGGDLGWVQTGQLDPELNTRLVGMSPGQISEPIRTAGGYRVLYLRNRREAGTAGEGELKRVHLKQVAIPLAEKPTPAQVQDAEAKAARISDQISGCSSVERIRTEPGIFVNDFGDLAADQISPFIRQAASRMDPGEPSPPLRGPGGIVILVVCSKQTGPAPKAAMPTKEDIQERMISQQLSIQSRRYLRDLRRDAVIEYRVPLVN